MARRYKTLIWVIEDDEVMRRQNREILESEFKHTKVDPIESLQWAMGLEGVPDIVLIDVTAITGGMQPGMGVDLHNFTHLVRMFVEKHNTATVGIYSMVNRWAEDLVEDLKRLVPDAHVEQYDPVYPEKMIEFVRKYKGGGTK